jgi:hypothetical protein
LQIVRNDAEVEIEIREFAGDSRPMMLIAALEKNGPTTFAGLDDPLEASILAVLIETAREVGSREALVLAGRHV